MASVADPALGRLGALKRLNTRPPVRRILTAWAACFAGEAIAAVAFGRAGLPLRRSDRRRLPRRGAARTDGDPGPTPRHGCRGRAAGATRLRVDVARAGVAGVAAAASEAGAPREVLFALAAALTVGTAVSNPPRRGLLPLLVEQPSELTAAGVVIGVVQAIAQTAGPLLAAVLFSIGGSWEVLAASAACFAVAALTEAGLPNTRDIAARPAAREAARIAGAVRALAAGFRVMRSDSELAVVTGTFAAKNLGRGALNVLIVVIPLALLGLGSAGVGWLTAILGAGGVAGGILATVLVGRSRLIPAMGFGLALWGVPLILLGGWPYLAVAVIGLTVLGAGNTITDIAGYTLIGRSARDDLIAAVYSVHEAVRAGAIVLGSAATAAIVELWGPRQALVAAGIGLTLAAAAAMLLRSREHAREIRPEYMELIRANPLFRWLPPIAVARLSSRLETVELDAGAVLLREGAPGDCAYLLESGELVADKGGLEIGRVRPGGVVGEIALLHDAPRMATVRAVTRSRLLMIEREEFLAAATGNTGARDEAVQLVDRRLAEAAAATRA